MNSGINWDKNAGTTTWRPLWKARAKDILPWFGSIHKEKEKLKYEKKNVLPCGLKAYTVRFVLFKIILSVFYGLEYSSS